MKIERAWRSQRVLIDDGRPYFAAATYLPVRSLLSVLPFMLLDRRIERQARQTPAVVAYGVRAEPLKRRFWTLSFWTSREEAAAFVRAEPHASGVRKFSHWAGAGAGFAEWESSKTEIDWDEAFRRLESPTFSYGQARGSEAPDASADPGPGSS